MCIRDRGHGLDVDGLDERHREPPLADLARDLAVDLVEVEACLLYTSDAADERSSVDLGGRRIIKKKKT